MRSCARLMLSQHALCTAITDGQMRKHAEVQQRSPHGKPSDTACCVAAGLLGDAAAFNKEYAGPIAAGRDSCASEAQVSKGNAAMNKLMETCGRWGPLAWC